MGLNLKSVKEGGNYFKPEDHHDAVAILIEVRDFKRQVPTDFGPKDTAYCDVTIFDDQDALTAGNASSVLSNAPIQQTALARDLADLVDAATIVQLGQAKAKPGRQPAWVWRNTSQDTKSLVIAYADKRDSAREEALAAAPDFD